MRNRLADNWRVLLAIADSLGLGERAREAMLTFAHEYQDADAKIVLLTDIRKVFDASGFDRMSSKALLAALHALDEAEWCEFRGTPGDQQPHKMRDTELASILRDFGIRPRTIWPPNRTPASKAAKGYRRRDFEGAWQKYCSDDGTASQASNVKGLRVIGGDP
ncbi:DUF3631 domain-containing protein [Bradyrhizobium lupini]|uniref:DUF3631 domain-containing protein n=1 Tax=Rhizobium lupini TaxID=136996 RepID=UPI003671450B